LRDDSEDAVSSRTAILVGLSLAVVAGCADLIGVQSLTAGDGGADAGCQPTWVAASGGSIPPGTVPDGPLDAGFVDYVCRVTTDGGAVLPGKLLSPWGCYYADDDGGEQLAATYEALVPTGCDAEWVLAPNGVILTSTALVCGHDWEGGALYSCQAVQDDGGATGNLGRMGWSTNHQCVYTLSGQALTTGTFDVLAVH
jgi:hypothetical protein